MLTIISVVSLSTASYGFAAHGGPTWDNANVKYKCMNSLSNVNVESGTDACGTLVSSAAIWNGISNSNLNFYEVSSSEDYQIHGVSMGAGTVGFTYGTPGTGPYTDADTWINTNKDFGDKAGADWWKWWGIDQISTTGHEFGHTIKLNHDADSDIMQETHEFDVHRTPSAHDISVVQGKYP